MPTPNSTADQRADHRRRREAQGVMEDREAPAGSGIIIQPYWRKLYNHHAPEVMNFGCIRPSSTISARSGSQAKTIKRAGLKAPVPSPGAPGVTTRGNNAGQTGRRGRRQPPGDAGDSLRSFPAC